jgi:hypothetical protein
VCTPRKRIDVLLSERNPEPSRTNRLQTLPRGGLPKLVAFRGGARQNPNEGGRALALPPPKPPENESKQPDEPWRDEVRPDEPRPDEPWIDPIYLFGCGLSWRKWRNASAGWELIKCLRSSGQAARIAAAFLSQAENAEVQEINSGRKPPKNSGPVAPASRRRWRL